MQWNRNYNISYDLILPVAAAQNFGQRRGDCFVVLILQLENGRPDGVIMKMSCRPDPVDGSQPVTFTLFTTGQAQIERCATPWADRRLDKVDPVKAGLTEPLVRIMAVHTSRR